MDVLYCCLFIGTCLLCRCSAMGRARTHIKHRLQYRLCCCVCVLRALSNNRSILFSVGYLLLACLPSLDHLVFVTKEHLYCCSLEAVGLLTEQKFRSCGNTNSFHNYFLNNFLSFLAKVYKRDKLLKCGK